MLLSSAKRSHMIASERSSSPCYLELVKTLVQFREGRGKQVDCANVSDIPARSSTPYGTFVPCRPPRHNMGAPFRTRWRNAVVHGLVPGRVGLAELGGGRASRTSMYSSERVKASANHNRGRVSFWWAVHLSFFRPPRARSGCRKRVGCAQGCACATPTRQLLYSTR